MEQVIVEAKHHKHHALTLVFLHGFGMTAVDMAEDMLELYSRFPQVRFVFPQAPCRAITAYNQSKCPAWYDYLTDYGGEKEDSAETLSVRSMRSALLQLIWKEAAGGVPMVIGGLSQGGCMALDLATRSASLMAVISCVSHRLHLSLPRELLCPWWALTAEQDEIFPAVWAQPLGAFVHEVAHNASHHLCEGQCPSFVAKALDSLLSRKTRSSVSSESQCSAASFTS
jgi:predicted esterase